MKIFKTAVLPRNFASSAAAAGIKKSKNLDVALLASLVPATASCLFTSNKIQAAPIKLNKAHLSKSRIFRAIIINSGNANCFTGKRGLTDADAAAGALARRMGIPKESVLVASTGIIARPLPVDKIKAVIPCLVEELSTEGIHEAKLAIMTTDKIAKEVTAQFDIAGRKVTVTGIAKGAGMIAPNMVCATMLSFIMTDASVTRRALDKALKIAAERTFNCITVDGCMSTNDSLMMLANGESGSLLIDINGRYFALFLEALEAVCLELAKMLVLDAEGATKFIRIQVDRARNPVEAKKIALSIANSSLFKTAMFASSPNVLGRIAASAGAAGVRLKEEELKIRFSPLHKKNVSITVSVGKGDSRAVIYTSDLSYEYVKINAEYN